MTPTAQQLLEEATLLHLPTPLDNARTFRAMARARLVEADAAKNRGDWERYSELREDVLALDEQADRARERAENIEVQRMKFARAIACLMAPLKRSVENHRSK